MAGRCWRDAAAPAVQVSRCFVNATAPQERCIHTLWLRRRAFNETSEHWPHPLMDSKETLSSWNLAAPLRSVDLLDGCRRMMLSSSLMRQCSLGINSSPLACCRPTGMASWMSAESRPYGIPTCMISNEVAGPIQLPRSPRPFSQPKQPGQPLTIAGGTGRK